MVLWKNSVAGMITLKKKARSSPERRLKPLSTDLELLFVSPKAHSKGIGYAAWCAVEKLHQEVAVWETVTPYFEKRNIHFYVNRCGFHIVEFFNSHHPDRNDPEMAEEIDEQFPDGMFRLEKRMRE